MEHPPETSAGDDDPQPSLSAASAIVPLRSVDGPASPPFVAHSSPPAPATEFSQRAPAPKKRGELEAGVPDSWRSRDRESRRTCRGECGECGAYVFTDEYREFHDNTYFHRDCYARKAAQVLMSTMLYLPPQEEEEENASLSNPNGQGIVSDLVTKYETRSRELAGDVQSADDGASSSRSISALSVEGVPSAEEEDTQADADALQRSVQQINDLHRSVQELARSDRKMFDAFPADDVGGNDTTEVVAQLQRDLNASKSRLVELELNNTKLQERLNASVLELGEERRARHLLQDELERTKKAKDASVQDLMEERGARQTLQSDFVATKEDRERLIKEHERERDVAVQELQVALEGRERAVADWHAAQHEAEKAIQFCEEAVGFCDLAQQQGVHVAEQQEAQLLHHRARGKWLEERLNRQQIELEQQREALEQDLATMEQYRGTISGLRKQLRDDSHRRGLMRDATTQVVDRRVELHVRKSKSKSQEAKRSPTFSRTPAAGGRELDSEYGAVAKSLEDTAAALERMVVAVPWHVEVSRRTAHDAFREHYKQLQADNALLESELAQASASLLLQQQKGAEEHGDRAMTDLVHQLQHQIDVLRTENLKRVPDSGHVKQQADAQTAAIAREAVTEVVRAMLPEHRSNDVQSNQACAQVQCIEVRQQLEWQVQTLQQNVSTLRHMLAQAEGQCNDLHRALSEAQKKLESESILANTSQDAAPTKISEAAAQKRSEDNKEDGPLHDNLDQTAHDLEEKMRALHRWVEAEQQHSRAAQSEIQQLQQALEVKEQQLAQIEACEREISRLKALVACSRQPVEMKDSPVQCMHLSTQDVGVQLSHREMKDGATQHVECPSNTAQGVAVQTDSTTEGSRCRLQCEDLLPPEETALSNELAAARKQLALVTQRLQTYEEMEKRCKVMDQRAQAAERAALETGLWKRRALETTQQIRQLEHRYCMLQNECQANKAASQASTLELRRLNTLASAPLARKRRQVEAENVAEISQTGPAVGASADVPEVQHGSLSSPVSRIDALAAEMPRPSLSSSLEAELSEGVSKAIQETEAQRRSRTHQEIEAAEGVGGKQISQHAFAQEPETYQNSSPIVDAVDTFAAHDESSSSLLPSHERHVGAVEEEEEEERHEGAVEESCADALRTLPSEFDKRPSDVTPTSFPALAGDIASSFMGISASLSLPANAKFALTAPPSAFEMPNAVFALPNFRLSAPAVEIPKMPSMTSFFSLGSGGNGGENCTHPDASLSSKLATEPKSHRSSRQEDATLMKPGPASVADFDVGLASGTLKGLV